MVRFRVECRDEGGEWRVIGQCQGQGGNYLSGTCSVVDGQSGQKHLFCCLNNVKQSRHFRAVELTTSASTCCNRSPH